MIDIQLYNITERTMWTKIKYASYLLLSKTRLNHTFLVNLVNNRLTRKVSREQSREVGDNPVEGSYLILT